MRRSQRIAGAVAAFAAGALVVGVVNVGGVSAAFTDSASATSSIKVGDFGCAFGSPGGADFTEQSDGSVTASFDLGTIQSSAPGSNTVEIHVENTGDMPTTVSWHADITSGTLQTPPFSPADPAALLGLAPGGNIYLPNPGDSKDLQIGFDWIELENSDLDTNGTVTYTFTCTDALPEPAGTWAFVPRNNGTSYWDGAAIVFNSYANADGSAMPANSYGVARLRGVSGSPLPSDPPDFATDSGNETRPNLVVVAVNTPGDKISLIHYSAPHGSHGITWESPGGFGWTAWSDAKAWAEGKGYTTVDDVYLISRSTNSQEIFSATVSCFQYDGIVYFGSGCEAP